MHLRIKERKGKIYEWYVPQPDTKEDDVVRSASGAWIGTCE